MKQSIAWRYLLLLVLGIATVASADPVRVEPTDPNLLYVGRWDKLDPSNYHGNWIASYVRTGFTGSNVSLRLGSHTGLVVSIDGSPAEAMAGGPGIVRLNSAGLAKGDHTLLVGVKGGGGWDFQGLMLDPNAVTKAVEKRQIIECVGDSITSGSPAPIEAAGNYNWLTAESLGCDHTQISWPARSLMSGYGFGDDHVGQDVQYFQQNGFADSPKVPLDFATYSTPTMVLINLGQNDRAEDRAFGTAYTSFLKNIRAKFLLARIVCIRPFSGSHADSIASSVAALQATGDRNVYFVDTTGWLAAGDFADGVHPNAAGHVKVCRHLTPLLKAILDAPAKKPESSDPVAIGDPANPAALPGELESAYRNGSRHISIRPGEYTLPATGHDTFHLQSWSNVTIDAANCTFVALDMHDIFNLTDCENLTLRGPLVARHVSPCGTQGRVIGLGQDPDGKMYTDWEVDAGYGTNTKGFDNFDVVKQETRTLGRCDLRNFTIEPIGERKFRIHWSGNPMPMRVHDWLVHRYSAGGCAVRVSNSHNCTIDGVTSQNGGHATFFESDGSGGNHFLNCGISCGPKPPGATEAQLVSNWADGLHSIGAFPGPDIENFTDSGILLDDCIAIRGEFSKVIASDPARKSITLQHAHDWLIKVNEPLRVVGVNFYGQANVLAIVERDGNKELTLDKPLDAPAGADCYDPLRSGTDYRIINCKIGGTRSRGIIAKGDNGLIKGCTIRDCGTGVLLGPGGGEAGYFRFVTVVDNTITNCREVGLTFESNERIALRDIRIVNNRFLSNASYDGDLAIRWTDGLKAWGNVFTSPLAWPNHPQPAITIEHAREVRLSGNQIVDSNGYGKPVLRLGKDVDKVTTEDPQVKR